MADRNERREPRWTNSGYWIDREDDDRREGDQALARSYDRDDMRRYGRRSLEQGERMRSMRGQESDSTRDYRHRGSGSEDEGGARRGDWRGDMDDRYREVPGYGEGHSYRERSYGENRGSDHYRAGQGDWGNWRYREQNAYGSDRPRREAYNSEMARGRGYEGYRGEEQDESYDRYDRSRSGEMGNFWGERQRRERYGQDRPWRDYVPGSDFDYEIEGGWDEAELDREYDMDPGFSYEFGPGFNQFDSPGMQAPGREQDRQGRGRRDEMRGDWRGRERAAWDEPGQYSGMGPSGYQRSRGFQRPSAYQRPSARISEEVNQRLTRHGQLDARSIQVRVEDGTVILSGSAHSKQDKYLAEYLAETVAGVRAVDNRIRVSGSEGGRTRGMGREDAVMPGRIRTGMRVAGMDGKFVGSVRQVRQRGFVIERPGAGLAFIPFRAVKRTNGQITLHVVGSEIDRQGWRDF